MDLKTNEKVLMEVHHSWLMFLAPVFWMILLSVAKSGMVIILPTIWFLYRLAIYFTDSAVITNQRFDIKHGILSVERQSIPLDKVNNIYFKQSFVGRIFNYGDICIQSGATFGGITYKFASDPNGIKMNLDHAVENYEYEKMLKLQGKLQYNVKVYNAE